MIRELLIIGVGIFAILGGALDWDFFMKHRKAAFMTKVLGRNGARIFYIVLGTILAGLGLLLIAGIIPATAT